MINITDTLHKMASNILKVSPICANNLITLPSAIGSQIALPQIIGKHQ